MEKTLTLHMDSSLTGEVVLSARYRLTEQEATLIYAQSLDPQEKKKIPEVLHIKLDEEGCPKQVTLKRPGSGLNLTFVAGEMHEVMYPTPAGSIKASLLTQKVDGLFTQNKIKLRLVYELQLGDYSEGQVQLCWEN